MRQRLLYIVNPISGGKNKLPVYRAIRRYTDASRFDFSVCHTKAAGEAAIFARKAVAEGYDIVVAVGGDGTINEVAREVIHTKTALGIIPCGSGNGLARHLQLPMNPEKAVRIINQAVIHHLDYGLINGQPFFCTCGVGFDAFISLKFAQSDKRGLQTYIENVLSSGLNYKPDTYTIEDESGTVHHRAFLIACANASQYGNNAYIAPQASMKDGLMDVIIMEPFSAIEAPRIALQLFNKTLPKNSHIKMFQTRKVRITRSSDGPVHRDGDPSSTGAEITVELVHGEFPVVVNPNAKGRKRSFVQLVRDDIFELWDWQQNTIRRSGKSVAKQSRKLLQRIKVLPKSEE